MYATIAMEEEKWLDALQYLFVSIAVPYPKTQEIIMTEYYYELPWKFILQVFEKSNNSWG